MAPPEGLVPLVPETPPVGMEPTAEVLRPVHAGATMVVETLLGSC